MYGLNVYSLVKPLLLGLLSLISKLLLLVLLVIAVVLLIFVIKSKVNIKKFDIQCLYNAQYKTKLFDLIRWILIDKLTKKDKGLFKEFGFSFYVGRQGAGKTISMVEYIRSMKKLYPKVKVVTNFKCDYSDHIMSDWKDILNINNGEDGVIFAIDEIHSEYSAASWKDVPESLLSEISQQRKQRVKIIASAQYYTRIAKPLREQGFTVLVCKTSFKRLTTCREYDAEDYFNALQSNKVKDLKAFNKFSFVQSDDLRNCYDTYEKIERMKKIEFIPRNERVN